MNWHLYQTDADDPPSGECPTCGDDIDDDGRGSLRWNGQAWEHKRTGVHPQAGYHLVKRPKKERGEA